MEKTAIKMRSMKIIGGLAVATLLVLFSCKSEEKGKMSGSVGAAESDTTEKIVPVRIHILESTSVFRTLDYTANFIAFEEINYAPASPGRINRIDVEVGDRIRKGQLLVEMDKTQLVQAQTQYETAKSTFQRVDTLYRLGSISEQQYEQTKAQYDVAKSGYEFLAENTTLLAPIDGIVTGKYFENGELYSGVPNTMAGKAAVLTLMQINPLKAIVSISQSYFPDVKEGMKAEIRCDIFPDEIFEGSVFQVYPVIDAATRTFKTEIIIRNPKETLRPGMYGRISIKLKDEETLVVPSIAVLKQEGTNNRYVFLNNNGVAKRVDVTIDKRYDDQIEITGEGIAEGAELIIEGQANLLDGTELKVVKD
jgi:membrane fusion protein, multidrug efflux system